MADDAPVLDARKGVFTHTHAYADDAPVFDARKGVFTHTHMHMPMMFLCLMREKVCFRIVVLFILLPF